ncbi:membrane-bound PQQ-dependent dehydrogenase, glucose/quinate/shikimate family [Kangiella sp. TOML190]|uniref:membrane-bound PQQ-dependent dehydrogenase, glucose/quinate/shikimate family n=1 Tax=Kangiella sp. TOML190 TaxID=2931351 RepID=UPI00203F995A|nr:membrane-bound PQQ-dependent dehydrogenase, glucose/quinate/shikimate family [Kangiella sp. TOML190]
MSYSSKALKALAIFTIAVGALLFFPGIWLIVEGGQASSWFYIIAGASLLFAGYKFYRAEHSGIHIYLLVCLLAIPWALYEVWSMQSWFWPLIPRLFSFAFLLLLVLLAVPKFEQYRNDNKAKYLSRIAAAVLAVGLLTTLWGMFQPQGVIQNPYTPDPKAMLMQATKEMGNRWHNYGGTTMGNRYIPAKQITRENIDKLEVAWTYRTKVFGDHDLADQNTPVFGNNTVFACTPNNQVHAIDGETGVGKWVYDPKASSPFFYRCRGVTYYEPPVDPDGRAGGVCSKRIAMNTVDARLFSLDAETGQPCTDFGNNGVLDLTKDMGKVEPGYYFQTSAPTVTRNMIIVGGLVVDNNRVGEPSGVIRAFDGSSGELKWAWDLGRPGKMGAPEPGETYTRGTPNVWTHPAVDEALGLIYLPMGNATPDVGIAHRRPFDHEYGASIVALDTATGEERWKFQTVYRDSWDYDLPSQPTLYDVTDPETGAKVPALIQPTKRGQIFMLNRITGKPIAEVVDKPVATDGAAPGIGELSPVQPYSVGMPNIGGEALSENHMWGATIIDQLFCRIQFRSVAYTGNEFPPPSLEPFFTYPGAQGGMNWGSGSVDETRGIYVINDLRLPIITSLIPREDMPDIKLPAGPHDPIGPQLGTPYALKRDAPSSILGFLCSQPPYGTISGIDLKTRKILWQRPVGTVEDLDFIGVHTGMRIPLGMPTLGGSVITGGGLVFFPNAMDRYMRVFDIETGEEIRRIKMPVGANATPMSYVADNGKQYVVASFGGSTYATDENRGDYVVAFALPDDL